ncbi:hypothetical protein [Tenacibaculum sp. M341]|uniref:hypothetical protein n=1 Tax=Tenacibaculum sp. M341 TaxID=2530339 RepID=UPI001046E462|nr:hypothetical protein [Tenacibaculum sp. M341]TCI91333.1 hypothetical protein EYW44_10275 [Tenacibaculum sp. M341]
MREKINLYLSEMQEESTNSGGHYHFSKLDLPEGENLANRLKSYLLKIEAYKNPYVKTEKGNTIVASRNVENLKLVLVFDFKIFIEQKLAYWSKHRTSLDDRDELTQLYFGKEQLFKRSIYDFLNKVDNLNIYELKGIDTYFVDKIGGDMVGDDIIFEIENAVYVLHFGWSS